MPLRFMLEIDLLVCRQSRYATFLATFIVYVESIFILSNVWPTLTCQQLYHTNAWNVDYNDKGANCKTSSDTALFPQ